MVANDMRVQVHNSSKDNHFTVLEFTAENGHPTMCAIINAASKLKVMDVTGFNPVSDDGQDVCGEDMKALQEEIHAMKDEHSNCANHMFPSGPTCTFNGVEVHICVTYSKNDSITSQLITNILSKMVIIASTGSIPFCYVMGTTASARN
jgi:hypothetical protein